MKGNPLPKGEYPHDSLVLWVTCKSMKWTHLPVNGGLFDQDPMLLRYWNLIWAVEGAIQKEDAPPKAGEPKGGSASVGGRKLKPSAM